MAFWNRWIAIRTEGGSRADLIDRLQAYLKAHGVKSKITFEDHALKRLHILKKDRERVPALLEAFDEEQQ